MNINKSYNPTFLGIRFDKYLSFKKSIKIFNRCMLETSESDKTVLKKNWGSTTYNDFRIIFLLRLILINPSTNQILLRRIESF